MTFGEGFNVITGETGAGKSLLVDALSFVAGQKPRGLSIRPGCEEGVVEALFVHPGNLPDGFSDLVIPGDDLVLRRVIGGNGRVRQTINGQSVSLSQLQSLVASLFDLVGQGENARMVQPETHRRYLDAYAQSADDAEAFETLRREILSLKKEREDLRERIERSRIDRERRQMIQEDALLLSGRPAEYEELSRTLSSQLHVQELINLSTRVYNALYEDDQGVVESLGRVMTDLGRMVDLDGNLLPVRSTLHETMEALRDAAREIRLYQESLRIDPEALGAIESRFNLYRRLAQKYGLRAEELAEFFQSAEEGEEDPLERELISIEGRIRHAEEGILARGKTLSGNRASAAPRFSEEVIARLRDLRITHPVFTVLASPFESALGGPFGMERIEFLFSANPGMPERPLGEVASGGELSRVLLAIKSVLAEKDTVPTLVFDEIDSGIGGEVGEVLGDLLKELGRKRQVVAITHLHQVARKGDRHLLVRKESEEDRTRSTVVPISGEDRVREIARMLGGEKTSPSTMTTARELLQ